MRPEVQSAVLKVLQESDSGFATGHGHWSVNCGLTRWQRFINWCALRIGAEREPFRDPLNYYEHQVKPLNSVADPKLIDEAMRELAPNPIVCRTCGSRNLSPDIAGDYYDAADYRGAPLLCLDCRK